MFNLPLALLTASLTFGQLTYKTVPDTDNGPAYVFAEEGTLNVSIYCEVINNNVQAQSRWLIIRDDNSQSIVPSFDGSGKCTNPADLVGKIEAIGDDIIQGSVTYQTNFTILNFTVEFDLILNLIRCGPQGHPQRTFNFGFPVLPSLLTPVSIQLVVENNNITVDLTVEGALTPFPPVLISQWTHEGQPLLSNGNDIVLTDYTITLSSVQHNQSGNYTLTVSNNAGSITTNFIIDVQYGPEGIAQSGPVYVVTNNDVIITSYTNISGNPVPLSNWNKDEGSSLSSGGRFNVNILGQLMITSVLLSDAGHYNNTLENTVVNTSLSISNIIELVVVDPPSQPRNVSIIGDPGPTTVNLTWHNPASFGTSLLSIFTVMLNPSTDGLTTIMINYTAANTTDHTFINSVMVTGLYPNTEYSVTVRAYSTHNVLGLLASNSSTVVIFNTTSTAPELQSVTLTNVNGNLTVKWTFIHTGGIPLDNISISCRSEEGTNITLLCESECTGQSVSVGPVTAGSNYTCIITATNSIGSDMMNTNSIIVITGIPSQAIINSVLGDPPGQATLYIYTMYSGITDVSTFQYIITVLGINQTIVTVIPQSSEFNGVSINATIELELSPGKYQFTVISSNVYGNSVQSKNSSFITVLPIYPVSTTSPQPTDNRSLLGDGVIAGIIISIIILLVLLIIVILTIVITYKVSSTKQRRGETSPVIKKFFSVKNEAYGITKGPDHKSSIDVTENVAYSTLEQQSSLITPPVYETINQDNSKTTDVYDDINDYV